MTALNAAAQRQANYGALNTSRMSNHDQDEERKSAGNGCCAHDISISEAESSALDMSMSQMGESVRYREHVSQYTRERTGELLLTIKDRITLFGMAVLVLVPATLLANGIGFRNVTDRSLVPLVVETGCNIGLNNWYFWLTVLTCLKLLIEIWRYMCVKLHHQESIMVHLGGNFVLMPVVFTVFFVYTQMMFERSNPDPEQVLTYREARSATLEQNECVEADYLSQSLYSTFQIVSVLSYLVVFYYIVAVMVVVQSACLIKAIVQRRIGLMRRRDQEAARGNGENAALTLDQF